MGFRGPSHARRAEAVFPLVGPALMGRDPFFSSKSSPRRRRRHRRRTLQPRRVEGGKDEGGRRWSGSAAGRSSWRTAPCPSQSLDSRGFAIAICLTVSWLRFRWLANLLWLLLDFNKSWDSLVSCIL